MDPHVPLAQRTRVDAYDRTIHEADVLVAHFLDELEALGIAERTFVVLLSDHGEAFGEHGLLEHGLGGHEEQLRVPLVIRGPGIAGGRRRADTASLVDVLPTVLDLLGLPPAAQAQGTSLRAAREAERPTRPRAVFFSWLVPGAHGVRYGRWKLMDVDGRAEIYDLSADPREHAPQAPPDISEFPVQDLVTAHRADNAARKQAFAAKAATTPAGPPTVSGMVERSLRLLGYL